MVARPKIQSVESAAASLAPSLDQVELAVLLLRVAAQDHAAFKQLYDATSRRLFGLALRMLKRRDVAEDVLQDAFIRIWQHAARYDPDRGAPMPWLWRILRNAAIDRLRRDHADHADIDDFAERLSAPEAPVDLRIDLSGGLSKLGAKKSQALSLAFVEGYTHEEIAEELAAPLGTVKSQLRRSLEQLRRHLEEPPLVARA